MVILFNFDFLRKKYCTNKYFYAKMIIIYRAIGVRISIYLQIILLANSRKTLKSVCISAGNSRVDI